MHVISNTIFRKNADQEGLLVDYYGDRQVFVLDLNQGTLVIDPSPRQVHRLVTLAREFSATEEHGEHQAMLQLVAERHCLKEGRVTWQRPYHVNRKIGQWISLAEWLRANHHPYVPQRNDARVR